MNTRYFALPVRRLSLICLVFGLALAVPLAFSTPSALARPEMAAKMKEQQSGAAGGPDMTQRASERFDQMDADKDGKVTWAEFSAYYPNMREAAFAMIDVSADGFIDRDEWIGFSAGHAGGGMGKSMPVTPPQGQGAVQGTAESGSGSSASSGGSSGQEAPQTDKSGGLLLPGIKSGK